MINLSNVKKMYLPQGRVATFLINGYRAWHDETGELYNTESHGLPYGFTAVDSIEADGELIFDTGYVLPETEISRSTSWKTHVVGTGSCYFIRHGYELNSSIQIDARTLESIDGVYGECTTDIDGTYSFSSNGASEFFVVSNGTESAITDVSWARNASYPSGFRAPTDTVKINVQNGVNLQSIYLKIDNVYAFNFIACLDVRNVPCLFDLTSQTAFYNSGSGNVKYNNSEEV